MKLFFQNFLTATTGRWAISLPSVAIFLPFSFLYSLERESMLNVGAFRTQLMIVTAGELAGLLYIFLAQAVLLSSRKERTQSFMLCIFVWSSSGIVSGLVSDFYGRYTLGTESHLLIRIVNSSFTSGLGLGILAYCFGSFYSLSGFYCLCSLGSFYGFQSFDSFHSFHSFDDFHGYQSSRISSVRPHLAITSRPNGEKVKDIEMACDSIASPTAAASAR